MSLARVRACWVACLILGCGPTPEDSVGAEDSGERDSGAIPAEDGSTRDTALRDSDSLAEAGVGDGGLLDTGPVDTRPVGPVDTGPVGPVDTGLVDTGLVDTGPFDAGAVDTGGGCTLSPLGACASGVVVVGHYTGGARTIDVAPGVAKFQLALVSYDSSSWKLTGATSRITRLEIFSYDPGTTVTGNGGIPTAIQTGPAGACSPFSYTSSTCAAHTGWAGCKYSVPAGTVCNAELGLPSACSNPTWSCLRIGT